MGAGISAEGSRSQDLKLRLSVCRVEANSCSGRQKSLVWREACLGIGP